MPGEKHAPKRTPVMMAAGEYWVVMCSACHHPGGLHIDWPPEKRGCRCCNDCPGYAEGAYGTWSDIRTRQMVPDWPGTAEKP